MLQVVRFFALMFAALALLPAGAHLLEMANKMPLSGPDYLVAQKLYRGWSLAAVVVIGALLFTVWLAWLVREQRAAFVLTLLALLCIVGTQIVFWSFTFPVNKETMDWSVLPAHWTELRRRWEFSHAASAVLNFVALLALIASVLVRDD